MPKISLEIDIRATKDRVWQVVSDLDHEYKYWYGTKDVRNISRNGNEIEREMTGVFRNNRILQKAILHPKDSIEVRYLKGLTEGLKMISIETVGEDEQKLKVFWDIHFTGIYWLLTPIIKRHSVRGTEHALERIKAASEANVEPFANQFST
jgi:hypothetical protein